MSVNFYNLNILHIEKIIFKGLVKKIKITINNGELEILYKHTPLIGIIRPGLLYLIDIKNNIQYIYISGGILEIKLNKVTILADNIILSNEINKEKAIISKNKIEKKIKKIKSFNEYYYKLLLKINKENAKIKVFNLSKQNIK